MKKILTIILLQLCICSFLFGATINSKEGYLNLKWGFTTDEVKKAGYEYNPAFLIISLMRIIDVDKQ